MLLGVRCHEFIWNLKGKCLQLLPRSVISSSTESKWDWIEFPPTKSEIISNFWRSYWCCWGLLHLQNSWQNQSVNEKTKLHLSTGWRWYMSSSPYKQAVATKWCNSDPQRKKKVAWQGDVFLLGMQPQPQTQQASYYWWYDGQNPAPLEMITCTSKISTIPSAAGILPSRVAFEHCSTENSKKLPLPKKTLMWITATYHQWNHPVDFVFVSRANKSQKDNQ